MCIRSGSSDVGLFTISFPARCVSYRAIGLGACPTGPPVRRVTSTTTPALWPCGPVPFVVTERMQVVWISIRSRYLCVYFDPKHSKRKSSA